MICHVISRLARAWAIPISHLIIIILDFPSGESSISFDKQGYDPPAGDVFNKAMTPPGVSQAVSQRKQDGNLTVRTLLLCSDTKVLLLFVPDKLQFKRSVQLKIGRYRLYIRAEANNMLLILSLIKYISWSFNMQHNMLHVE